MVVVVDTTVDAEVSGPVRAGRATPTRAGARLAGPAKHPEVQMNRRSAATMTPDEGVARTHRLLRE